MEVEKRHEALTSLLNAEVFETPETITVSYKLQISSGETVHGKANQIMLWDKSSSNIYVQKWDLLGGPRDLFQYATCASKAISEGLL